MRRAVISAVLAAVCSLAHVSMARASDADWLSRLNQIRAMAGLSAVEEDPGSSEGCAAHARYMSANRVITHSEDPALPFFTPEGDAAARRSNLVLGATGAGAIDLWATGPFHLLGMIDPRLVRVGFGSYAADGAWPAAALDVMSGRASTSSGVGYPILWPGPGSVSRYLRYSGHERPDPLAGTGFASPTGAVIVAQFGTGGRVPVVTASQLSSERRSLAHVVYTERTYTNPDPEQQRQGRAVLASRDAVIIVPRSPLLPGRQYDVALTVDGRTHAWSFTTAGAVDVAVTAPARTGYAQPVDVGARLERASAPLAGKPVVIEQSTDGSTWRPIETTCTCDAGSAVAALSPTRKVYVRATFPGDALLPARSSAPVRILPMARVGPPGMPATVRVGASIDATGVLLPRHRVGSRALIVQAQRLESGRWVTRARFPGYALPGGAYRVRIAIPSRGAWRVRAHHAEDAQNAAKSSAWRYVTAR